MALNLGSLYVSLNANANGLVKGFAQATAAGERVAKEMKRISAEIATTSAIFAGLGAAAVKMAASVDGPTKTAVDGLQKSTQLLAVQIADMLLPAISQMTQMFKTAAGVVAGLSPETKAAVSSFAVLAVTLAAGAKAFSLVAAAASSMFSILKGGFSIIATIGVGPLLSIVAGIGLVIGAVLLLHRAWRKNWGDIQGVTSDVLDWLRDAFGQLAKFFGGLWDFLVDGAKQFVDGLLMVGEVVERVLGKDIGVKGMREGFAGLWKDLKSGSFFSEAFTFGKSIGAQLVDGIAEEWGALKGTLGLDKLGLNTGSPIGLGRGAGAQQSGPITSGAMGGVRSGIDAGAGFLREMNVLALETQRSGVALALARKDERAARDAIVKDLEHREKISRAVATGNTGGLSKGETREVESTRDAAFKSAAGAGSWGDAQTALQEGIKGAATFGDTLKLWGMRMGPMLASAGTQLLGAVGDLVNSVVQGAQQGGVWGAIIAAFMEVAKKTASAMAFLDVAMEFIEQIAAMIEPLVAPIFDALTNVLGIVIDIVEPVFKALEPLFSAFGQLIKNLAPILYAIGDVFQAIAPILEFLGRVIGGIFNALKPVFELIAGVIKVIATVVLGFIIGLNEIAAALGDEAAKAESGRLKGIVEAMWNRTTEMDMAASDAAAADLRKAAAADKSTKAVKSLTESLTNLPSGYRIQMARYDADLGLTGNASASLAAGAAGMTVNGDVNITTGGTPRDGQSLADEIKEKARRNCGQQGGNPTGRGGRGGPGGGGDW